jgi:hypothetical protein
LDHRVLQKTRLVGDRHERRISRQPEGQRADDEQWLRPQPSEIAAASGLHTNKLALATVVVIKAWENRSPSWRTAKVGM